MIDPLIDFGRLRGCYYKGTMYHYCTSIIEAAYCILYMRVIALTRPDVHEASYHPACMSTVSSCWLTDDNNTLRLACRMHRASPLV